MSWVREDRDFRADDAARKRTARQARKNLLRDYPEAMNLLEKKVCVTPVPGEGFSCSRNSCEQSSSTVEFIRQCASNTISAESSQLPMMLPQNVDLENPFESCYVASIPGMGFSCPENCSAILECSEQELGGVGLIQPSISSPISDETSQMHALPQNEGFECPLEGFCSTPFPEISFSHQTNSESEGQGEYASGISSIASNREDFNLENQNVSKPKIDLRKRFQAIVVEENLTRSATEKILELFRDLGFTEMPKTKATLTQTPRDKICTREVPNGEYFHFGIQNFFAKLPGNSHIKMLDAIIINVNTDGLPLFDTTKLWPILGHISGETEMSPFLIGAFVGRGDPKDRDLFLAEFIEEVNKLIEHGIYVTSEMVLKEFKIGFFCCDSPARALITGVKNANALKGCFRCDQVGYTLTHTTVFQTCIANKRTNSSFRDRVDPEHHNSLVISGLEKIPTLDMVNQIVIDPMHTVDLGVTKRIIEFVCSGKRIHFRLRPHGVARLNMFYIGLAPFVPVDFNRKPRSFDELCYWKATEFRLFGFYTGLLVAHDFFPVEYYEHFLLYFCAIRLMSTPDITPEDISLARDILNRFVQEYADFYEQRSITYNVHALLHLPEIVEVYGSLDVFSAYRFENFLNHIKGKITKKHQVLPQLFNRMEEEFAIMPLKISGNPSYSEQFRLTTPYFGANFAYRTCNFSTYKITANERDGCCEIDHNFAISVVGFCEYDGVKGVIGRRYQDQNPFFLSPVNSIAIGVYKVTSLANDADFYEISRITGKFMRLPHENAIVLIKLLHKYMTE